MMGSLFALMFLAFGLTFVQYRKGFLGPVTGIKTFATGRLIPTDMVRCAVGAANITIGQAVYLTGGKVLPASSQADTTLVHSPVTKKLSMMLLLVSLLKQQRLISLP